MKNLSFVFGKAFALFFLLFTIPRLLEYFFFPFYIRGEIRPSLTYHLVSGTISALIVAIFGALLQMWYVRRWARRNNISPESLNYDGRQKMEMEVASPLLAVFQDLKERLSQRQWKIAKQDESKGLLQFKVVRRWQLPVELVTIHLEPTDTNNTRVKVDSKINSLIAIIDSAHNLDNVHQVRLALTQ